MVEWLERLLLEIYLLVDLLPDGVKSCRTFASVSRILTFVSYHPELLHPRLQTTTRTPAPAPKLSLLRIVTSTVLSIQPGTINTKPRARFQQISHSTFSTPKYSSSSSPSPPSSPTPSIHPHPSRSRVSTSPDPDSHLYSPPQYPPQGMLKRR